MISFRFHIISITAIFLAMAIGVLVGSTFVDRAIVDGLQNRIDTVEANLEDGRAENALLDAERDRLASYVNADADFAVTGRLVAVPLALVALRGVDEEAVERVALLASRAGAVMPGVIWIEEKFAAASDSEIAELQVILASEDDTAVLLQRTAFEAVAAELRAVEPPAGTEAGADATTTTTAAGEAPVEVTTTTTTVEAAPASSPVFDALLAARFLTIDPLDDATAPVSLAGTGARVLLLTSGTGTALAPLVPTVLAAVLDGGVAVVADIHREVEDGPGRGEALVASLAEELLARIVIVDDADLVEGAVAAVLAVDAVADGLVGHFGYGTGADAALPQWSPP